MTETLWIGGQWQAGKGALMQSINPATGMVIWQGNSAAADDVDAAIAAARNAFKRWGSCPFDERLKVIRAFANLLVERKAELAQAIMRETGKALWDAEGEVGAMAGKLDISLKAYEERTGSRESTNGPIRAKLTHRPHGVMAVFGPYNFPGHLPNGHIIPALLAGNTVVFKPSEQTPMVAEITMKLWQEAGLPDGVLNLVQGARETGMALSSHADINGLLFTGSVPTGQAIAKSLADRPEVITALELGGNNPLIVWGASDLEAAALLTIQSAYITTGQRCTCARRLIVPAGDEGDKILASLTNMMKAITVGQPDAEDQPFMGSLISAQVADGVLAAQEKLVAKGATALVKAEKLSDIGDAFISPGLIDVTGVEVEDEEIFGPVLQVYRVPTLEAAIDRANATRFGLSAGILTDDFAAQETFFNHIRAGIVNWNQPLTGASSAAPFGGIGASGNHRASAYYAADYCAWPMASLEHAEDKLVMPAVPKGIKL